MENKHIYQDWLTLSQITDNAVTIACFKEVEKKYTQEGRYYHTLAHIKDVLDHIKASSISNLEKQLLTHVAVFHDVIYIPGATDNEYQSAQFASFWLEKLGINSIDKNSISQLILATSNHTSDDPLTQLFLDMDLSILGSSTKIYTQYCEAIRKEYKKISLLLYRKGRKRFLKQILRRMHIFNTEQYHACYEQQARINILEEIKNL